MDYRVRPAKSIERKMIAEMLLRFGRLRALADYQYVGMGSYQFRDFIRFHRDLGIAFMVSMESDTGLETRVNFNKPYDIIDVAMGAASSVLPSLDWARPTFAWLDYNSSLSATELDDLAVVAANANSGDALFVTLAASVSVSALARLRSARKGYSRDFGELKEVGAGADASFADAQVSALRREVETVLRERNLACAPEAVLSFVQFADFRYQDGAKMLTWGGAFVTDDERELLLGSPGDLATLSQCRVQGEKPFEIRVPTLTPREQLYLDASLPKGLVVQEDLDRVSQEIGIPPYELRRYAELYRYYPTFAEADL